MDISRWVTTAAAARTLRVNKETVRRHILAGKLRAVKPGGEYLVDPVSVAGFEPGRPGRPPGSKDKRPRTRRRRQP